MQLVVKSAAQLLIGSSVSEDMVGDGQKLVGCGHDGLTNASACFAIEIGGEVTIFFVTYRPDRLAKRLARAFGAIGVHLVFGLWFFRMGLILEMPSTSEELQLERAASKVNGMSPFAIIEKMHRPNLPIDLGLYGPGGSAEF